MVFSLIIFWTFRILANEEDQYNYTYKAEFLSIALIQPKAGPRSSETPFLVIIINIHAVRTSLFVYSSNAHLLSRTDQWSDCQTWCGKMAKQGQTNPMRMVRWIRWHCLPNTAFKIWSWARYLMRAHAWHLKQFKPF